MITLDHETGVVLGHREGQALLGVRVSAVA
jgi:hypothetical protein